MNVLDGFGGIVTYEHRSTRGGVLLLAALMAVILAAMLIVPALFPSNSLSYSGISDSGVFPLFMIVTMMRAARKDTTFFLARPVSRRGVWLGLMACLIMLTLTLAALRTILALVGYSIVLPLTRSHPGIYSFAPEAEWNAWKQFTPNQTLPELWKGIKDIVSAGLFAYCYGCLLERWKGWTIGLSIGLPVLGFVIFVVPVLYAFMTDVNMVVDGGQASAFAAIPLLQKWIDMVGAIRDWLRRYWDWLFWSGAALCVPVSFFVMRMSRHTA
ncbi:MAG: hypothetical protein LBK46_09405 [Oscillospiraceae bacterium]|jgi:hypothetical protein|nr:hypothetical protein [Oscillospiraceae bacterium]